MEIGITLFNFIQLFKIDDTILTCISSKIFQLTETIFRRQIQDEVVKKPKHDFFDPNNREAKAIREACMEVRLIDS